jgi:thiol-disulfide isomerase/thioredoxin
MRLRPLLIVLFSAVLATLACSRAKRPPGLEDEPEARAPGSQPSEQRNDPSGTAETDGTRAAAASADAAEPTPTGVAARMPMLSARELLARIRTLGDKGTLVNAWASFCGPCRREIPMLEALSANLRAEGIAVYLVSLDDPADAPKAEAFLTEWHITLESALARPPLGAFKQAMNPRWPGMLPASFLFDAAGRLRYFWGGEAFEQELVPVLDAFAQGKPIEGEAGFQVAPEAPTRD